MQSVSDKTLQKFIFIMNALENGWKVKKRKGSYVFTKRHEGRRNILKEGYLERFLEENMNNSTSNGQFLKRCECEDITQ
jgi:predicted RNA binding protein YcfA (HicA-like mRNA interferase family)